MQKTDALNLGEFQGRETTKSGEDGGDERGGDTEARRILDL